jgi:4-hydroxy-3-methylbut-2-enyl diphosphate reductase IspH
MAKRRTEDEGRALVEEFRASGVNTEEFLRKKKICRSTLERWLARFSSRSESPFLPVTISPESARPAQLASIGVVRISFPTGLALEAPASCDPTWLARVVGVLS